MNLIYLETLLNDMLAKHANGLKFETADNEYHLAVYKISRAKYTKACADYVTGLIADAHNTDLLSRADSSDDGA